MIQLKRILTGLIFLFVTFNSLAEVNEKLSPKNIRKLLKPYMKMQVRDDDGLQENKPQVDLGRILFYDKRLSKNEQISCNDCHDLSKYGTNGAYYLKQLEEKTFFRDVPSIYNKANFELFNWDGSQTTLSGQTAASLTNEYEMGATTESVVKALAEVPAYVELFKKAFPADKEPLNVENIVKALVAFQTGLVSLAPIDRFLKGDDTALNEKELAGAYAFDERSCFACHTGSNFGGQMVIKLGIIEAWPNQKDKGYFHHTKNSKHKMVFRVSPLRNVDKTGPYFHDASSRRLWDAVQKMSWYELGQDIGFKDVMTIIYFLKTLTGDIPEEYIKKPEIP
jgi:cytochrome c peroxidase